MDGELHTAIINSDCASKTFRSIAANRALSVSMRAAWGVDRAREIMRAIWRPIGMDDASIEPLIYVFGFVAPPAHHI